ncbi:hypothetical protein PR048_015801 [Dryococelus australis]|uniref:DDE Tnp4 domain-containing protein n=1 Tax=Dryococelus australis TaxID=614101 RepID=A0ABQ9HI97_9NEOP|nr:hypothetical protein PR048_015801 [Dryococelus australis]
MNYLAEVGSSGLQDPEFESRLSHGSVCYCMCHFKIRHDRLHWVHPINERRERVGLFNTLFEKLRNDENKFFNYFRMSIASYDVIHIRLKDVLQRQNTKMRNCIQPVEMLAVAYLASGRTFNDIHYTYRIGVFTARKIVRDVCKAIWLVMRSECISTLTKELWESTSCDFETIANFPYCLGAVDGKHIRITCPCGSGSTYFNYKDYYSVVLMEDCDSSIFKKYSLWKSIETDSQQLPEEKCLAGTESRKEPCFFVRDEVFGLPTFIENFWWNSSHTGKKSAKLPTVISLGSNVRPDFAVDIANACIVLHNFVREKDGYLVEDTTAITGLEEVLQENVTRGGLSVNTVGNILSKYFLPSVGAVPWQMSKM